MVEWGGSFGIYFVITDILRFYGLFFFSYTLRGPHLSFYVFTCRSTRPTVSRDDILLFSFSPAAFGGQRPPVACLAFYVFTYRSAFPMPFGDSIFRCTAKDRGERRAKGIAIPLNPLGNVLGHSDVLCAYRLATGFSTRLSRLRRSAYPLASACCAAVENSRQYREDSTCSRQESVEAVRSTPRTGLNRVNCTRANS